LILREKAIAAGFVTRYNAVHCGDAAGGSDEVEHEHEHEHGNGNENGNGNSAMDLNRRRFLQGSGTLLGLPWLPSLYARRFHAEPQRSVPVRTAFLHFPNGVWEQQWTPATEGPDYQLTATLQPLQPVRDQVLVLSGLDKPNSRKRDGHAQSTANFLTGMPVARTTGNDISAGGVSVDQLIAAQFGHLTPLPSLVLGVEPVRSGIDRVAGITLLYGSCISWQSQHRPIIPEISPTVVFDRLFGKSIASDAAKRRAGKRLLDTVLEDARTLAGQLGRDDRQKLDEYLESVNSIEDRIRFAESPAGLQRLREMADGKMDALRPMEPLEFRDHLRTMLDLTAMAFQSDSTRTVSLMMANDVSHQTFPFLEGVKDNHHSLSHHQHDPDRIAQYQKINQWYVQQFADFLGRLQGITEHDGTLLDHSMILFGSGMSDGDRHDPDNLPILLAGKAGGRLETGRHLRFAGESTPLCNLYMSMLQRLDIPAQAFGDSTAPLI
jgi:hypothetical protein